MGDPDELVVATTLSHLKRHRSGSREAVFIQESDLKNGQLDARANTEQNQQSKVPEPDHDANPEQGSESKNSSERSDPDSESNTPKDAVRSREGTPDRPRGPTQNRKQWKNVLLTATSFVLTKDARKKVRQVLALLRLASEHLNTKVNALRLAMEEDADHDNVTPKISHMAIRNDIINTIKKCMAMFSTLATNSLPSAARARVRNTILKLPTKWANQLDESSTRFDRKNESAVLALATETLVAIKNITNILSESMDRADSWVEKLPNFSLGKRRRLEDESDNQREPEGSKRQAHEEQESCGERYDEAEAIAKNNPEESQ